jgi:hypothetical protein
VAVQSIRAAVEIGDPACDGLLLPPIQVPFGKMHGVTEAQDLAKKIRTMTEALQDAGHLLPAGLLAPFIVHGCYFASRVCILNEVDLGLGIGHRVPFTNGKHYIMQRLQSFKLLVEA